jgi:hypothetical protein
MRGGGGFTNCYKELFGGKISGMNTDARLDRLTERHEALAESLQLLTADVRGLAESVKEHDRVLRGHADLIGDLARVATAPEQRLEGRQG